jgi:hypothetical protein
VNVRVSGFRPAVEAFAVSQVPFRNGSFERLFIVTRSV